MKKKPITWSADRLPLKVRNRFPEAKTVSDATERISIQVTAQDKRKAVPHDPSSCAMALACRRTRLVDGAWIGIGTSYILNGTHLTRYRTPHSVAREIVSFDRHADFAPGEYALASVSESQTHQMGPRKGPSGRKTGTKKQRAFIPRHRTVGVRGSAAAGK